jgi:hypothetical protein
MADDTTTKTTTSLLPPPRLSGDAGDAPALAQWLNDVHKLIIKQGSTINNLSGSTGTLDPNSLPDPAKASIASAQATANAAYQLATQAEGKAEKFRFIGQVTISDAATTGDLTLPNHEVDTGYFAIATAASSTGTPASGSRTVAGFVNAVDKVTVSVVTAPGVGNSVIFNVALFRVPN